VALNKAAVGEFNDEVQRRVVAGAAGALGANAWWLDTHALFSEVIRSPGTYPETKGYRNTTDYCVAYAG
jgi:phospholipase/lecithinase/hemolysin